MTEKTAVLVEPWLRGTHGDLPPVARAVVHALDLAAEDIVRWTDGLTEAQFHATPMNLPSIGFQLRHIARSLDRLLTYAEGDQLSADQLALLRSEADSDGDPAGILDETRAALSRSTQRVRALAAFDPATFRGVGRKQLPTSVGGLLVHVADHTQRHVGQLITTVKVVRASG